jgi:hypothetical protein
VTLGSGESFSTGVVLSNANPQITLLDLVEASELPSEFRERVANIKMKGSAFKVGLALDGLPRLRPPETTRRQSLLPPVSSASHPPWISWRGHTTMPSTEGLRNHR